MDRLTQPLRDEHRALLPHVDEILAAADALGGQAAEDVVDRLKRVAAFLRHDLLRHASAEEAALYPVVRWAMDTYDATATMARDHVEIARLSDRLSALVADTRAGRPDLPALRRVLYGLHAVVALHFAKEEEIYLPLLDERLTPDAAARMFAELEEAAEQAA